MADRLTRAQRSMVMSRIRSKGNRSTELRLIELMRRERITGWRRHLRIVGCPDFVFLRARVVVFVDGCFWHGCKKCFRMPTSNVAFWAKRIGRNRERDREQTLELRSKGWRVIRIWEHALTRPAATLRRLQEALNELDG